MIPLAPLVSARTHPSGSPASSRALRSANLVAVLRDVFGGQARRIVPQSLGQLSASDNDGYPVSDPERPYALGLVGLSPQWADITGKLHRLGISIETNTAGVVSGITFADDQSKRAWDNWWAVAKCSIQPRS